MRLIDITRIAQEAPIYPGSNPIQIQQVCDMAKGGPFNASMITMGSHMGTHADAFCHFLPESDVGIDRMPLEAYYGPCRVLTVKENTPIAKKDLVGRVEGAEAALRAMGFCSLRVRLLGEFARLQLPGSQLAAAAERHQEIRAALAPWFDTVLLDLQERQEE